MLNQVSFSSIAQNSKAKTFDSSGNLVELFKPPAKAK
jgi:hypothetical protein